MGDDVGVIPLIVFLVLITAFFAATFWYGLRGESNSGPALGTNRPYPDGSGLMGADEPPYLPTPVISDAEIFRREAHGRLQRIFGKPRSVKHRQPGDPHPEPARSWMEEPGAMEAAGLVDAPNPGHKQASHPPD